MLKSLFSDPSRRKMTLLLAGTVVAAVLFVVAASPGSARNGSRVGADSQGKRDFEVGIPTLQKVEAFVQGYGNRVEATESDIGRLRAELQETRRQLQESLAELAKAQSQDSGLVRSVIEDVKRTTATGGNPQLGLARVRKFEFAVPPEEAGQKESGVHIPAGSFGEATILTGLFAPVTGEALPVHARLDVALVGPNRSQVPIAEAFLVGRAQGDANSARAIVQFHKLSLVTRTGKVIEVAVNADVADSDGIMGMRGTYVWRADEVVTLAGLSGAAAAAAEALSAREVQNQATPFGGATSILTGDPLKFAGTRGLGKGLERISEAIGQRLNEILPAVYVPNGRKVTVLFLDGATLPGLAVDEVKNDARRSAFTGLDFDR